MNTETLSVILAYIDTHIHNKISLLELAGIAGYSPFYFSKLFSEAMGMPVTGYIRIRKLQYALASLLEGRKVLDVSLMYAFESHEGFTRSFTQMFGTTPSKAKKYLLAYQVPPISFIYNFYNFRIFCPSYAEYPSGFFLYAAGEIPSLLVNWRIK